MTDLKYNEFVAHVGSTYPLIWLDTSEYSRAIYDLSEKVQNLMHHKIFKWDCVSGLSEYSRIYDEDLQANVKDFKKATINLESSLDDDDPLLPIEALCQDKNDNGTVCFAEDYHLFLKEPSIWRRLLNYLPTFKEQQRIFVIVSPVVDIPEEIRRYITVIDYKLPDKEALGIMLDSMVADQGAIVEENMREEIINSGTGLSMFEFENALFHSYSLNHKKILPDFIHRQKRQLIRKSGAMDIVKPEYGFERIAGLDNMKPFVRKMVGKKGSKGILIVGVPGGGKSAFAKALGKETGRMSISLDIGALQGSYVGQSEKQTKEALQIIDSLQPAILLMDEVEKGLAGVGESHSGDSGTSKRQGGQILGWLNDHTSDVYVIATCNNIDGLPPEYLRSGRWDAIFFVDVPTKNERKKLMDLYSEIFDVKYTEEDIANIDLSGWTGAEIETLFKLAKNLETSLEEASRYVCPIIRTAKDKMDMLRNNLKGIAVNASLENVENELATPATAKRKVMMLS